MLFEDGGIFSIGVAIREGRRLQCVPASPNCYRTYGSVLGRDGSIFCYEEIRVPVKFGDRCRCTNQQYSLAEYGRTEDGEIIVLPANGPFHGVTRVYDPA